MKDSVKCIDEQNVDLDCVKMVDPLDDNNSAWVPKDYAIYYQSKREQTYIQKLAREGVKIKSDVGNLWMMSKKDEIKKQKEEEDLDLEDKDENIYQAFFLRNSVTKFP